MWCLAFDFGRKIKEIFRYGELSLDFLNSYAMINECEETGKFGSFNQLLCDLLLAIFVI